MKNGIYCKAKRKDINRWVVGKLYELEDGRVCIKYKFKNKLMVKEVIRETVCEAVNLIDGYKNPVFMGDILMDLGDDKKKSFKRRYVVEEKDGVKGLTIIGDGTFYELDIFTVTSEIVIGNIHDYPELLKMYKHQ